MAHKFFDQVVYNMLWKPGFPMGLKIVQVTPADNVELEDASALWVGADAVVGTGALQATRPFGVVRVRWEDDTVSDLPMFEVGFGPFALMGVPIKQVLASGSDVGKDGFALDGTTVRAGTVYTGNHLYALVAGDSHSIPNRSPMFRGFQSTQMGVPTYFARMLDSRVSGVVFTADAVDLDFDDLTWAEVGTWPSKFVLATSGNDAGQITYTKSGKLTEDEIVLDFSVIDGGGVNKAVPGRVVIEVPRNRPPVFGSTGFTLDALGVWEADVSLRKSAPTAVVRELTASDPEGDALTWAIVGVWSTEFTLVARGATHARIVYTRVADLVVGATYALNLGVTDHSGSEVIVLGRVNVTVVA